MATDPGPARTVGAGIALLALALALAVGATPSPAQQAGPYTDAEVARIHARARPLDAHADVLVATTADIYRTDDGESQLTTDKLTAGGMAAITFAIHSPNGPDTTAGRAAARAEIDAKLARVEALAAADPERLGIALSADDVDRLNAAGRIAVLIGFQNAYGLGEDLSLVDRYVDRGVRVFAFNHAGNNAFADSSRPSVPGDEAHGGLSPLGRDAVRRLNARGVLIDVSQLTPRALLQTVELSTAPVVATHSAIRALVDETRNLTDAELEAIAGADGAVCLPPFNTYIAPRPPAFVERLGSLRVRYGLPETFRGVLDDADRLEGAARGAYTEEALATVPRATLGDYVDQIDYAVDRVGVDHVCIGTDFDHGAGIVGFADASDAANLTRALLARGYSADAVAKIWSGNFLRVLRAAENAAD